MVVRIWEERNAQALGPTLPGGVGESDGYSKVTESSGTL